MKEGGVLRISVDRRSDEAGESRATTFCAALSPWAVGQAVGSTADGASLRALDSSAVFHRASVYNVPGYTVDFH